MANTWFRLYSEFATDPKVQMMTEAYQRRLIMVFCLRCDETLETLHETEMAFHLRISEEELAQTKDLFISKGFIDGHWNLQNWNSRQFISDSSTERVRKYRQGKKQDETLPAESETFHETPVTQNETAPEQIQNRTDTEQKQSKKQTPALTAVAVHADSVFELPLIGKQGEWGVPEQLYRECVSAYPGVNVMGELAKLRAWLVANPAKRKTPTGLPRCINSWMARAQDNSPRITGGPTHGNISAKPNRSQSIIESGARVAQKLIREFEAQTLDQREVRDSGTFDDGTGAKRLGAGIDPRPVAQDALGDW